MFTSNRNRVLSVAGVLLLILYLWFTHKSHVIEYWEYLFLTLFIALHLLMHIGHGHSHGTNKKHSNNEYNYDTTK
ncbi:hypothetical protein CL644_00120 [bacterium]|nr:hypothetical protein [bacterium]